MKLIHKSATFLTLFLAVFLFNSCDDNNPLREDWSLAKAHLYDIEGIPQNETESGVTYYIIEEGKGSLSVTRRDQISIYFTARTLKDMDVFDSSYRYGRTTPAMISDIGTKTEGFKEGVKGMKEGEKRVLIVPPELGYGTTGSGGGDTLRYELELDEIKY